jgi:hypothetical protein
MHLSIALADYENFGVISDKELFFIFEKYKCEKELDEFAPHPTSISSIEEEAEHLSIEDLMEEDEEEF